MRALEREREKEGARECRRKRTEDLKRKDLLPPPTAREEGTEHHHTQTQDTQTDRKLSSRRQTERERADTRCELDRQGETDDKPVCVSLHRHGCIC